MTCLGVNLTKSKQDLYPKNYKTLMREIKENPNRERSYIYGSGDTTLLRCLFFPNRPIYPMQLDIKIKIPGGFFFFFGVNQQTDSKIYIAMQNIRISQKHFKRKNKVGELIQILRLLYKTKLWK